MGQKFNRREPINSTRPPHCIDQQSNQSPRLNAAAASILVHVEPVRDSLLHGFHMRDDPDRPARTHLLRQHLQHLFQRTGLIVGIEAAKPLVYEDRIQVH